ncbi:hypothetical protein WR25_21506 isoform C [Diploscapter pachys]|uniref:G-protein coupled receptors family 1 profile domain-containing protein n=1 Tax=Diploscapter pachys TaxID=2018661 RepID=A0A2A2KDI6_9BILA|nr:hypothetical protein WR25_21506 isoform C [Diploscapter pachys]
MLPIPMTIADQILGFWIFGTFSCKIFRLLEHIGKIFSTFILVAFSIDRYSAVCHPLSSRVRSHKVVYLCLGIMFIVTCLMLLPILIYAHSKEYIMMERIDHATQHVMRLHIYKCTDDLGNTLFIIFTLYCFLLAYLMPLLLMIYFYYGMLIRLYRQARAVRQALTGRRKAGEDKIPIGHIATYTLAICIFHFICWTPYWMSMLRTVYQEVFLPEYNEETTYAFIYFMYGVHALPYINSACNFILYGLLNRQLHNSPDKKYRQSSRGNQKAQLQPTLRLTEFSALMSKGKGLLS